MPWRLANRLGGLHSARLLLASVDFAGIEELQRAGDWERAGAELGHVRAVLAEVLAAAAAR